MTAYAVGIDIGTTSVKALALTADGVVLGVGSSVHGITEQPGLLEASPERWWDSTVTALGRLADRVGRLDGTAVVGLSGNMSSVVLVDPAGQPLRDALLLADVRGAEQLNALPQVVRSELERRTHNRPGVVFSLASLLWLQAHEPAVIKAAASWLSAKDYVRLRLTGTIGTEVTDAYNSLVVDPEAGTWDETLISAVGLDPGMFPTVNGSAEVIGGITPEAARCTGLPSGTPVIAGMGDMAAAVLGVGDPNPGTLVISLGTSVTAIACIDRSAFARAWTRRLTYHPLPDGLGAFALASLLTGGLALNWLRTLLGPQVATAPSGEPDPASPLVFLPHLSGSGTPDFRPELRGTFLGLQPDTSAAAMVQALYEAIAFELADVLALLGPDHAQRVLLTGGGTNIAPWVTVLTDILDRPTETVPAPDVSAVGAARLAWRAVGELCPLDRALVTKRLPRPDRADTWHRRAARYRRARRFAVSYYTTEESGAPR